MARKRDRAFALFGAGLFLLTSSALTIAVVYSLIQQHQQSEATAAAAAKSAAAAKAASTASTTKSTKTTGASSVDKSTKLAGTKLANFTPTASIPTLQEIDITPGTGAAVKAGDTVTVDYTGAVAATGVIFQSSLDSGKPISFPLGQVIKGWQEGIPGMKVGGTRRLLIPAALAYGANPPSGAGIPANADLVFDVTLHAIK
jgi:FKBP-type peptidyl-prolyl cis-trans isomerase